MLSKILIANRGEIALRIIRACRELGIRTVAVYSTADRDAGYLNLADEAVCIGGPSPAESYLNIPRIISAAEVTDVEAIHPGYGFLAENAHFAEICRSCNIEFIGPSVDSMRAVGDKIQARHIAKQAKAWTVPGSDGPVADEQQALDIAHAIGYPVIIKAAAGGGGRGMRVSHNDINLTSAIKQARSEAEIAFKDGTVYIEKFIEQPRHVEVQILADAAGNTIHLYERDCSLQRRHQKLVEETPAPNLDDSVRQELCKTAVRIVRAANYVGAGTVEFIVDADQKFYFLEVNARIQVEHPISEMVTGVDLVKWQIRIASGEPLTLRQKDIRQSGHSIECRINAEDPDNGFRPSPGTLTRFRQPGGLGVRVDTQCFEGYRIPPNYDSLIAKLIVHQPTRGEAIACMQRALAEFQVEGIKTSIPLHRRILASDGFQHGRVHTGFLDNAF
ncbi:MAG: acetyl-CoA carboxylase biotin carboxylase subunit [Planctomycetes bacterium]|nr:acetyl-CoA carboxylase biotin carboxylase subunit [Planctomycetota bacterium]